MKFEVSLSSYGTHTVETVEAEYYQTDSTDHWVIFKNQANKPVLQIRASEIRSIRTFA